MTLDPAFDALVREPARSGVFVDFDGTLSDIVDDPAAARPRDGAVAALSELARVFGRVAILSGRPVAFLEPQFAPPLVLAGLYGLETVVDGEVRSHPLAASWREAVDHVAVESAAKGPAGMRVESKGLSLTLHFRGAAHIEHDVRSWAEQQAASSGLVVRGAKMSYELHPPIEADKGTTLLELADGLSAVCYFGDDVGDLPAFDALDQLATRGIGTVRVGVRSADQAEALLARADVQVAGPAGVVETLQSLVDASRNRR